MDLPPFVYTLIIPRKVIHSNYTKIVNTLMYASLELKLCPDFVELLEEYPNPSLLPKKLREDYPDSFKIYSYNYKAIVGFKNAVAPQLKVIRFWGVGVT